MPKNNQVRQSKNHATGGLIFLAIDRIVLKNYHKYMSWVLDQKGYGSKLWSDFSNELSEGIILKLDANVLAFAANNFSHKFFFPKYQNQNSELRKKLRSKQSCCSKIFMKRRNSLLSKDGLDV